MSKHEESGILFSYIVTVYNSKKFLRENLESLLSQTYQNYEIVIVDDGSGDGSEKICDEYQSNDKCKVLHQNNLGQIISRLNGADMTIGDYICFIDSDDYVLNNHLEEANKILSKQKVDILLYSYDVIYEDGQKYYRTLDFEFNEGVISKDEYMNKWLISGGLNPLWRKIIKRELIYSIPKDFRKRIYLGGDKFISLPLVCGANTFYSLNKALICYRLNSFSISNNYKRFSWRTDEEVKKAEYKYFGDYFNYSNSFKTTFFIGQVLNLWNNVRQISVCFKENNERTIYLKEMREYPLVDEMKRYVKEWNGSRIQKKILIQFYDKNWEGVFRGVWLYMHTTHYIDLLLGSFKYAYGCLIGKVKKKNS